MVRERLPWVRRKRAEMLARAAERPARSFTDGETLPFLGVEHPLRLVHDGEAPVTFDGAEFVLSPNGDDPRALLVAWYTRRGRAHLGGRTRHFAARLEVTPVQVAVRDLGRRWGSCGANGRVRFHWSLMTLPPELADYVVVHELAHLRELNHSPRFWALVERVLPELPRPARSSAHRRASLLRVAGASDRAGSEVRGDTANCAAGRVIDSVP